MSVLLSATAVQIEYTGERAETGGSYRQTAVMSKAQRKRVTLTWQNVGAATETAVRQHFDEYGQRGRIFRYHPPPLLSNVENDYSYDEPLTADRTNPRNVSMRCVIIEAMAGD